MLWVLVEDMHWHLLFDIKPFLVAWTIWQRLTVDKIDREDTRTGKEQDESVVLQWILHKTCSWNRLSRSSWCFEFSFKTCNMEVWNIFLFDIKPLHAAWSFWPGLTVDKIGRERIKENLKKHKLKVSVMLWIFFGTCIDSMDGWKFFSIDLKPLLASSYFFLQSLTVEKTQREDKRTT